MKKKTQTTNTAGYRRKATTMKKETILFHNNHFTFTQYIHPSYTRENDTTLDLYLYDSNGNELFEDAWDLSEDLPIGCDINDPMSVIYYMDFYESLRYPDPYGVDNDEEDFTVRYKDTLASLGALYQSLKHHYGKHKTA